MPAPGHVRVTFSGTFGPVGAPVEIFSHNLAVAPAGGWGPGVDQALVTAAAAAASTAWRTHLRNLFTSDVSLTRTRVAYLNSNGLVERNAAGGYVQADDLAVGTGGGVLATNGRMPLSTALAVSLVSGRAGASGKGRFFLPWPGTKALGTDFRMSADDALAVQTAARSFLVAVRAGFPAGSAIVVPSAGSTRDGVQVHGPVLSEVLRIRVGRVPDTMRSRRSGLLEEYGSVAL